MNLQIQEAQQLLRRIKKEAHTEPPYNQTIKIQSQSENLESNKIELTSYINIIL